jgi:hypothetical protein
MPSLKQWFRGVVWPRQGVSGVKPITGGDGAPVYRYAIVGLLCTDKPIKDVEGHNEVILNGHPAGIAEALEAITRGVAVFRLGDASSVLTNLDRGIAAPEVPAGTEVDVFYGDTAERLKGTVVRSITMSELRVRLTDLGATADLAHSVGDEFDMKRFMGDGVSDDYQWAPKGEFT